MNQIDEKIEISKASYDKLKRDNEALVKMLKWISSIAFSIAANNSELLSMKGQIDRLIKQPEVK